MSNFNSSALRGSPSLSQPQALPSCPLPLCLASRLRSGDAEEEESREYFSPNIPFYLSLTQAWQYLGHVSLSLYFSSQKLLKSPTYVEMHSQSLLSKQKINS